MKEKCENKKNILEKNNESPTMPTKMKNKIIPTFIFRKIIKFNSPEVIM